MRRSVLALLVLVAACGGGTTTAVKAVTTAPKATSTPGVVTITAPISSTVLSVTTTASLASFAAQYEAIVAPANAAADDFVAATPGLANADGPTVAKAAAPVVAAFAKADEALLRVAWPAAVAADIKALVFADAQFEADLGNAATQTNFSVEAWGNQVVSDIGRLKGAVRIVRADLGLPPKA